MKKLLAAFIVICATGLLLAGTSQFVGGLITVNNTTNVTGATAFGAFKCFPPASFAITNSGLTATNALRVNGQFSLDGSNWTTVVTYWPSATNATNEAWYPAAAAQTAYWRLQTITTNSVDLSIVGDY